MRGVVSLAAALALPLTLSDGRPFPGRDYILFITFCVIRACALRDECLNREIFYSLPEARLILEQ